MISPEKATRIKHRNRAKRLAAIFFNPCGYHCPKDKPFACCWCDKCAASNGYFDVNEKDQIIADLPRLLQPIAKWLYRERWDEETGYLGTKGCRLIRWLRALGCLETVCKD